MNPSLPPSAPVAEERASLWAARLDGSVLSATDRLALEAWLAEDPAHRGLLSHYCQFSADLEQQLPLIEGIRELSVENLTTRETAQPLPWLRWPMMAGAALTAAAAVAVVFWLARPSGGIVNLATPVAQRQELSLADGTRIELNAQTSLQIEMDRAGRHVRLAAGEAYFVVSKDPARPFIIETPAGSVRVTGTKFAVRAEAGPLLEVTVAEGSVQVRPGETGGAAARPVMLGAHDHLTAGPGGVEVQALSATKLEETLAWRQGQIVFDGAPLREALARFARYHGRGITATAEVAELRVGGRFSLDDLDGFFAALEEVLPVQVTRNLSGTVQVGRRPGR